jgi:hypothetical protein
LGQSAEREVTGNSFHLNPIALCEFSGRVADAMLEWTVVGQDHKAFTIPIEATGGIDLRHIDPRR